MDRIAELDKLTDEATARVDLLLTTAKAEGRDEDHLNEAEVAAVEKDGQLVKGYKDEKAKIERARAAVSFRREAAVPAKAAGPVATGGPAWESDPAWGFKSYGQFLGAVRAASLSGGAHLDDRLRAQMATGMSRLTGQDGGWLSPPAFETRIWDGVMERSEVNLISMCDQRTVTNQSLTLNASAETSEADGSRQGGTRGYWLNEGGTLTASRPTFRQIELKPKKLAVLSYATEELLADANALTQELEQGAAREIRYMANRAIVRGTGVGQPKGILTGTSGTDSPRITVTAETGQTIATPLLAENVDNMWSRLAGESRGNAIWLIHPELEPSLQQMGREVGVSGWPAYMPPGGLSASPYGTLKGRPVVPCKWCSGKNTEGDIILADMRGYLVGVRGGIRSESSIHVQFLTDEIAFRHIFRIDGQTWRAKPLTLENGSSFTVSEFVTLATRT